MVLDIQLPITLRVWLLLAAALIACSHTLADDQSQTGKQVVVVGAGIAGLNAARILAQHDFDVTVLESRGRIGGRLWSDRTIQGAALDLGASWIHGIRFNPVYKLARQIDVPLYEWDYEDAVLYDADGEASLVLSYRMGELQEELMASS